MAERENDRLFDHSIEDSGFYDNRKEVRTQGWAWLKLIAMIVPYVAIIVLFAIVLSLKPNVDNTVS